MAAFVLLHLDGSSAVRETVRALLFRCCGDGSELSTEEAFVIERLKVPPAWVFEAKVGGALV